MTRSGYFSQISLALAVLLAALPLFTNAQNGVSFRTSKANKKVEVLINGSLFTALRWDDDLKKPILFPINSARGTAITRGFPIEPRAGESVDHPHQSGLWFNYGDINGVDFWNNSIYRTPEELKRMGTIVLRRIVSTKSGKTSGELSFEADWKIPDGKTILRESTKFIFYAGVDSRAIDRLTTLTALTGKVVFGDSKEGMFGLRFRRELEQPTKVPILLTDANGKAMETPILDNKGVSGEFLSSDGKIGDAVWGTRSKWASLTGRVGNEAITISMFDDPTNLGFPGYWMARGYGLFASNPLGRKAYENKEAENFTLEPKRSITFRHRLVIHSRKQSPNEIEGHFQDFTRSVK